MGILWENFVVEKFPACVSNRKLVFHHFVPLNKHTNGKQFATDTGVKQAVTFLLQMLDTKLFCTRVQVLVQMLHYQWFLQTLHIIHTFS